MAIIESNFDTKSNNSDTVDDDSDDMNNVDMVVDKLNSKYGRIIKKASLIDKKNIDK